jgi:NTE family protein
MSATDIAHELASLRRVDFWDPAAPLGGLLRGEKFARKLGDVLARTGVQRIEDCPTPFAAVAHDVLRRRTLLMDRGPIDLAIRASCTVPLMFRPVWSDGRLLVDGGVSDRSGFAGVESGDRVLFHCLPSRRRLRVRRALVPAAVPGADALLMITPGVPKVSPFRLRLGPLATARTLHFATRWLDEPVTPTRGGGAQPTGVVVGLSVPSQPHWKLSRKT